MFWGCFRAGRSQVGETSWLLDALDPLFAELSDTYGNFDIMLDHLFIIFLNSAEPPPSTPDDMFVLVSHADWCFRSDARPTRVIRYMKILIKTFGTDHYYQADGFFNNKKGPWWVINRPSTGTALPQLFLCFSVSLFIGVLQQPVWW